MNIDTKIKKTFRLFEGKRSEEEDKKIFDKVYDLCFEEMIQFLIENLGTKKLKKFEKELNQISSRSHPATAGNDLQNTKEIEILLKYLSQIENYRFRLDKRLDNFLNNLLYSSLKKARY